MRLKGYFFILTFFLIILGGVILYFGGWIYRPLLYGSEILIAFLLIYLILFYRKIIKPLDTIGSGMELLREQDFSSRLSLVGQYEARPGGKCLQSDDGTVEKRTSPSA